ncbi:MAG: family 78 glycoside hydrolase catalytic domain [Armatimonadota bacterium]|nr:family 78 glycoside hydrolase catalytic domain [Armatimonadota bacterium]
MCRIIILCALLCLVFSVGPAAASWKGKWIWDSGEDKPVNYYLYVRKTFNLPGNAVTAPVRICADSRYKLYVNGRFVGRGPVRSDPRWQYYDTYDLSPYLTSGKNVIAALVHHYGTGTFFYILGRGGFIFDGSIFYTDANSNKCKKLTLASDESWRVLPAKAWFRDLPRMDVQLGFNEVYDANLAPDRWTEVCFDDSNWEKAKVIGPPGMDPWPTLVPSEIPQMYEQEIFPTAIYEIGTAEPSPNDNPHDDKASVAALMSHEVRRKAQNTATLAANPQALIRRPNIEDILRAQPLDPRGKTLPAFLATNSKLGVCTVYPLPEKERKAGKAVYIVLDFGREITGYPRINILASSGGVIDIGYGELLTEGKVDPHRSGVHYADRYRMKPNRQTWETFDKRAFRYIQLDFRDCSGPVVIESISVNFSTYPVKWRGYFRCSDERLNEIWKVGAYTVQLNMEDAYTDCPWRERTQWWGDARVEAITNYYVFGDTYLIRKGIKQIGQSQKPNGITMCFWPGTFDNPIPAFCLYWIMSIHDYYIYTGDRTLVAEIFPKVKKLIGWFEAQKDAFGLLTDLPHWNFIDWTAGQLKGTITAQNCLYYKALLDASELAKLVGDNETATKLSTRAEEVKLAINSRLFDYSRGMYAEYYSEKDKTFSSELSQMPNGLATLYGIAPVEIRQSILAKALDTSSGIIPGGPFFSYFFLEALFENNMHSEALDFIKTNWGKMLDWGATTLWENWHNSNSLCHGWSSAPTSHLSKYILGISPAEPGFRRVSIAPNAGGLDWAKGCAPTPLGDVEVDWKNNKDAFRIAIKIPKGMKADVSLPLPDDSKTPKVLVNGSQLLPAGVSFSGPHGGRAYLTIEQSGSYELTVAFTN